MTRNVSVGQIARYLQGELERVRILSSAIRKQISRGDFLKTATHSFLVSE